MAHIPEHMHIHVWPGEHRIHIIASMQTEVYHMCFQEHAIYPSQPLQH